MKKFTKVYVVGDGLAIYRRLQGDDQDSVRLLTVEDLIAIAQQLTPVEVKEQLLMQIRQTVTDKSWRVRYMAASHFNEVRTRRAFGTSCVTDCMLACGGGRPRFSPGRINHALCSIPKGQRGRSQNRSCRTNPRYANLLFNVENDMYIVRLGFSKLLEKEVILARIVPCVRDLCQDTSQHVRAEVAKYISGLAPLLGKEATTEHLLQLFLHLLKDEFPEVRLNIISKLDQVNTGTCIIPFAQGGTLTPRCSCRN